MREAPQCDADFPACDPAQPQAGKPVPLFALPSSLPRSTSSAPVMRSNVSMAGSLSRFSTRETIVSPDRVATSFNPKTAEEARESRESPRMGRTPSNQRRKPARRRFVKWEGHPGGEGSRSGDRRRRPAGRDARERTSQMFGPRRATRASFYPVTCSYLPHFIRVHWRYSRAKSGSEFNESFCRSRSSRSNSINRPITASRSDAFDTPASYATGSLTGDATIGTSKCALRTGI